MRDALQRESGEKLQGVFAKYRTAFCRIQYVFENRRILLTALIFIVNFNFVKHMKKGEPKLPRAGFQNQIRFVSVKCKGALLGGDAPFFGIGTFVNIKRLRKCSLDSIDSLIIAPARPMGPCSGHFTIL